MIMKNWMLFLVLLISINKASACAWWPEGEYVRFSLFSSHLAGGNDMSELFYSAHLFNSYRVDEYTGPSENLNEWHTYFDEEFSIQAIDEVIYRFNYSNEYYNPNDPRRVDLSNNRLMIHFKNGGHTEAWEYLSFAIQLEEFLRSDPWSKKEMDIDGIEKSIKFAESKLKEVKDEQIKLRYAYQLVVMNHYRGNSKKVEYYYRHFVLTSPVKSVLKSWAQFYYANLLEKDYRLYNYSRVFDDSKSKCMFIFQNFPDERKDVEGVLKLCKNNVEKASVLSILAFKNPGRALSQIKEIADLNASDELMNILLIREINKMEDWYLTDRYTSYGASIDSWWDGDGVFKFIHEKNFQSDKNYLKSFKSLCEDICQKKQVQDLGLWYTSLAYMNYMLDDKPETDKYLKLSREHAKSKNVKGQLAVIKLLHLVKHEKDWSTKFQQKLMQGVREVETFQDEIFRYERFHSQLMLAISRKYLEEDNLTVAALFESKVKEGYVYERYSGWDSDYTGYQAFDLMNENASSKDLDDFFKLWNKKQKTPIEKWLFSDMEQFKWKMTELWATQYLREDSLERALEIYKTMPDSIWEVNNWQLHYYYRQELRQDPFESNIYGRSYDPNIGETYTKPEFVQEIIRLKKSLDGPVKDKAHAALQLGNAYYNMGYNGNSYYYTEYSRSGYESDDYPRDQSSYYSSDKAFKYYKLAEELAPNEAYAAFCYRMQMKCRRDSYYNKKYWKEKSKDDWNVFANKYPNHFGRLKNCDELYFYTNAWKSD
jgi:hypothetical protein